MINPIPFQLITDNRERNLIIEPVNFQAEPNEPILETGEYLIYEDITPYDEMDPKDMDTFWENLAHTDLDSSADEILLGAIQINLHSPREWIWKGLPPGFTQAEFAILVDFIVNYKEPMALENTPDQITTSNTFITTPVTPADQFMIEVYFNGEFVKCEVLLHQEHFEVQFPKFYILVKQDETMKWSQQFGWPLDQSIIDEVGKAITAHYD